MQHQKILKIKYFLFTWIYNTNWIDDLRYLTDGAENSRDHSVYAPSRWETALTKNHPWNSKYVVMQIGDFSVYNNNNNNNQKKVKLTLLSLAELTTTALDWE